MPPGKRFASLGRQLICIPSFVAIFGRRLGAASELARLLSKVHPVEPHWYLAVLGVDDSCQGRGAVSYTHLDVYKRQALAGAAISLTSLGHARSPHRRGARTATRIINHPCTCKTQVFVDEHVALLVRFQVRGVPTLVGSAKTCLLYTSRCV